MGSRGAGTRPQLADAMRMMRTLCRRPWTAIDLAAALEMPVRKAYRMIETLEALAVPVERSGPRPETFRIRVGKLQSWLRSE